MIYLLLFEEQFQIDEKNVIFSKDIYHYLLNVRRVKNNEIVEFSDGKNRLFTLKTLLKSKKNAVFEIVEQKSFEIIDKKQITVVFSAVDFKVLEQGLKNGVEAGANNFIIISTEFAPQKTNLLKSRQKRFETILFSSSSQSRRKILPKLEISSFEKVVKQSSKKLNVVMHPYEFENTKSFFNLDLTEVCEVFLWVGPEGGFSKKEVDVFKQNNFVPLILDSPILRTENAVTVGTAFVKYFLGKK